MMSAKEVKDWLGPIEDGTMLGIDDGGLILCEVGGPAYLEVGGIPEADEGTSGPNFEEDDPEPDQADGGYLCARCERPMPSYHAEGSLCIRCEMHPDEEP